MHGGVDALIAVTPDLTILQRLRRCSPIGSGILRADFLGWLVLAAVILLGGKFIWWATERAWGKFS
jgi:hypothetical protein